MNPAKLIFGLLLLGISVLTAQAQSQQDSTRLFRVETVDGNTFTGHILNQDNEMVVLFTSNYGEVRLTRKEIRSIRELTNVVKVGNQFWLPNPQSSRYYWAPNGYGLEEGSAYYQNIWVFYNYFSYAPSNSFSIGAGMLPLFLFGGAPTPIYFVPKFSVPVVKDKVNIGAGTFLGTVLGEDPEWFGLLFESTTFGSRDRNVSLGFAWGFAAGEMTKRPVVNLSTMLRTGPRGYFISENYYFPIEDFNTVLISLGGRSIIRNVSLDYSLWIPFNMDMDTFVAIPFLGLAVPINNKTNIK